MKKPNADQQEVIADTLEWIADHKVGNLKLSTREIRLWVAYLTDEETANDPVILDGIYEGLTNKKNR